MDTSAAQLIADMREETALIRYLTETHTHSDIEPIFEVRRPSPRGGAEQSGGRSLLHVATVGLVLGWLVIDKLVARFRRRSPRGTRA